MRICCTGRINKWKGEGRHTGIRKNESIQGKLACKGGPKGRDLQQNVPAAVVINSWQQMTCAFILLGLVVTELKWLRYVILRFLFSTLIVLDWLNKWPLCRIVGIKI